MQKKILRIGSTVILMIIVICTIYKISNILELKESDNRYAAFFTEKQQIDVIFLGSSHVRHGFFTMDLWRDYGISAYNLGANGGTIATSYWALVNALDYQVPKVIVLDVYDCWPGRVVSTSLGQVHTQFDAYPLSVHKVEMVYDLFDDPELTDGNDNNIFDKRWDILWNLGEYHTRWAELSEEDFKSKSEIIDNSRIWKGASPFVGVVTRTEHVYDQLEDELQYDELSRSYLEKIIELCNTNGIKLLLINTGYDCSDEAKLFHDSVRQIAVEKDLIYIDFTSEEIINFDTDLYSSGHNTHVNFSGAERFTKYIGNVLHHHYDLVDHRQDSSYSKWWEDYSEYIDSKHNLLLAQTDIKDYLTLLNDDDYQLIFEVRDTSILADESIGNMFENLGINVNEADNLIVIDVENESVQNIGGEIGDSFQTDIGNLSLMAENDNLYGIYINNKKIYTVNPYEDSSRLKIVVYSKYNNAFVDIRSFE